ncbi:MAG: hypothetical protein OHK0052_17500 [Anaerolineales bacterium]
MIYLPILSTLVTFAFATAVFRRYQAKGGWHLALWAFGLLLYGLGTLSEAILSFTFSIWVLKLWYLTGAMLTAAWLGQGSVHLLVRRGRIALTLTGILGALSLLALIFVALMGVESTAPTYNTALEASLQYKDILVRSGIVIFLTVFLNLYGTLTLVGGALYSAFLFWRKQVLFNRMMGNLLIAGGALLPALAGSLLKAGTLDVLYLSELFGVAIMFAGFWLATADRPVKVGTAVKAV